MLAGHESEHGAVLPGRIRRMFSFWASGSAAVDDADPLLGAGHPWAPGFPRVETAPLVPVATSAATAAERVAGSAPVVSSNSDKEAAA